MRTLWAELGVANPPVKIAQSWDWLFLSEHFLSILHILAPKSEAESSYS
jgi:hypothetical protein